MNNKELNISAPAGSALLLLIRYGKKLSSQPKHAETNINFINFVMSMQNSEQLIPDFLNRVTSSLRCGVKDSENTAVQKLAKKSLAVYAQLAEQAGMHQIEAEIEDLAFQILMPAEFQLVTEQMNRVEGQSMQQMDQIKQSLQHILSQAGLGFIEVKGRKKHAYSVYRKLAKSIAIDEIYDLVALRVLVPETDDCYRALDVINDTWPPLIARIKDYIAKPKSNGYQSLHTTVRANNERLVEIQVRTPGMHMVTEGGLAAHYLYNKSKDTKHYKKGTGVQFKLPKSNERIYIFTPTGDIYALTPGAVVLDFAFALHTNIGLRARGVEINGKIACLDTELQNGSTLHILTQKSAKPKPDWLKVVKSSKARNRIRGWLRAVEHDRYAAIGKTIFAKSSILNERQLPLAELLNLLKYQDPDDLYVALGSGLINIEQIRSKVNAKFSIKPKVVEKTLGNKVIIGGMRGLHYQLASCCSPVPPISIVGYVSKFQGVNIHRLDCHNLPNQPERLLDCTWE